MTPRGWCVFGAAVTAMGVGLLAVEGALVAGGLVGVVSVGLGRCLARRNLGEVVLERKLPGSAFAGDLFRVRYLIRVRRGGSASAIVVDDTLAAGIRPIDARMVGKEGVEAQAEMRIDSRGVVTAGDAVFRSNYPLGIFETERWATVSSKMIVFPRPIMTRAMVQAEEALDAHAMAHASAPEGSDQFRGVREFRPGDPVMRIHWPATARAGKPMVCEFDPPTPQPSQFTVIFHSFSPPGHLLRPRAFEIALSMVSGLFLHGRGVPAEVVFTGCLNGWVPLAITSADRMREALEILACARYRPERSADPLCAAVRALPQRADARVFILSDTPVELWAGLLPATSRPLICLDTKGSFRKVFRMGAVEK